MPLINKAWNANFARKMNLQVIADRGWNPLNYNILTVPEIQATMTKDEKRLELNPSDDIKLPKDVMKPNQQSSDFTDSTRNDNDDTNTITAATSDSEHLSLNFSTGVSAHLLE